MRNFDKVILAIFVVFFCWHQPVEGDASWSYVSSSGEGPKDWANKYSLCKGTKQSPIDLKNPEAATYPEFVFSAFDKADTQYTLKNNGHTALAQCVDCKKNEVGISGGGLAGKFYRLHSFHFHWGSTNDKGSEHAFNGTFYPLELHIVNMNKEFDGQDAMKKAKGLAVLSVMFEVSPTKNAQLEQVSGLLKNIKDPDDTKTFGFALKELLPKDMKEFYRYEGSLTTPGCYETVTWTVFKKPLSVSVSQLQEFRKLLTDDIDGNNNTIKLLNNFRPLQTLGTARQIFEAKSEKAGGEVNGAETTNSGCLLLVSVVGAILAVIN